MPGNALADGERQDLYAQIGAFGDDLRWAIS